MKPAAHELIVREWKRDGRWSKRDDVVVMEEPLQLSVNGEELSVVMRTPGNDVELALGLFFAEGIIGGLDDVREVLISAESAEDETRVELQHSILDSNSIDVRLRGEPRRRPKRSLLASSACGVCGAVMIDDLKHGL